MYEKFYNLNRAPFSLLPDPEFLLPTRRHAMALTLLQYSLVAQHSFIVMTGEVGSGKTTLINKLLDEIGERHTVGLMNFTDCRMTQIWPWILDALDVPRKSKDKAQMQHEFNSFLRETRRQGRSTVLIVDEAQNLAPKALEHLRMLSNANNSEMLVQTILVGQPEFLETLKRPDLRQLNQRIGVFYRLEPLTELETGAYIAHRLQCAGGSPQTFSAESVAWIWAESGGIPRRINTLCEFALVYGCTSGKTIIDSEVVREMLEDRHNYAVPTNKSRQIGSGLVAAARFAGSNSQYDLRTWKAS